jgi:hypothetical protein
MKLPRRGFLHLAAGAAAPDQARIGRLKTPDRTADVPFHVDVLVVGAAKRKVCTSAYWPGLATGVARAIERFAHVSIFPSALSLGSGKFALDFGLNVWRVLICTAGYVVGLLLESRKRANRPPARSSLNLQG